MSHLIENLPQAVIDGGVVLHYGDEAGVGERPALEVWQLVAGDKVVDDVAALAPHYDEVHRRVRRISGMLGEAERGLPHRAPAELWEGIQGREGADLSLPQLRILVEQGLGARHGRAVAIQCCVELSCENFVNQVYLLLLVSG